MTQKKKQIEKTLALPKLPLLERFIPDVRSRRRAVTLPEYLTTYRRNSVWFAAFCTAVASVATGYLTTTANEWLWIWPSLTILLALSEFTRASQFRIEPSIFPWIDTLRTYVFIYDMAAKVWNAGLEYSVDEALATQTSQQLIQKYWELQYARRYLSGCIDRALKCEMKDEEWQKLEVYMKFFKEHCTQQ